MTVAAHSAPAPAPGRSLGGPAPRARMERSVGTVDLSVVGGAVAPRLKRAYQAGAGRVRLTGHPTRDGRTEALVLNTSGGLASGDTFDLTVGAHGTALTVSTLACERVYRCEDGPAQVRQRLVAGEGASLLHAPQPTIVFDGARLDRRTVITVARGAQVTAIEGLVLGRAAHGEEIEAAHVHDRLEVRHENKLAFVDALRLGPAAFARRHDAATLSSARAVGLVVHVGRPDAVDVARAAIARDAVRGGASVVNGITVARVLAATHTLLQGALGRLATALAGAQMPRAYHL